MSDIIKKVFEFVSSGALRDLQTYIAENGGSVDSIRLLTLKDESGRVPLHWASSFGHKEMVQWLLDEGCPVDPTDESGWTPLIISSSAGRYEIVKLLLSCGAFIEAKTAQGRTAAFYAASRDRFEVIQLLSESHADLNVQDELGASILHRVAGVGHTKILLYLLENYSNKLHVNARDGQGNTPLHIACEEGKFEIIEALLKTEADTSILNKEEKLPLDMASSNNLHALKRTFQKYL